MTHVDQLLSVARTYATARGLSLARVSTLVFNDGKVLDRLANGKDLTTGRLESSMTWFSVNWPADAEWPADILRPMAEAA